MVSLVMMMSNNRLIRQENGNVMMVMMASLSGLLALSAITLLSVRRGFRSSSQTRFQTVALYAAESGLSAGMDFLRGNEHPTLHYSSYVRPSNQGVEPNFSIAGNGEDVFAVSNSSGEGGEGGLITDGASLSAETIALFSGETTMGYTVLILNNKDDPGFAAGSDEDGIVILRSEGRGPGNSMVVLEVEVSGVDNGSGGRPCPGYAQRGIAEDGAGRNDCLKNIDYSVTATFKAGGS